MYTIPLNLFSTVLDWFFSIFDMLDNFSIGGLFTLLDLSIAIMVVSLILPALLNLARNNDKGEK